MKSFPLDSTHRVGLQYELSEWWAVGISIQPQTISRVNNPIEIDSDSVQIEQRIILFCQKYDSEIYEYRMLRKKQ